MKRPLLELIVWTLALLLLPFSAFSVTPVRPCADLMNVPFHDATVTTASEVSGIFTIPSPFPGFPPQTVPVPTFCRVALTVEPAVKIEVWLPKDTWNQRYRGEGGGGYAGSISYGGLVQGINAGYVTASTDTGHPASAGGTFALNPDGTLNNQLIFDFAERSLHEMVKKAKVLIFDYYGQRPLYSYWNGCSTGGRQGLMAAQRFPEEYDGYVIAAPAINWDRFIPAELWPQIVMNQELGVPIAPAKLSAFNAAAIAACDAQDGVADGVINDPRKCDYDPAASVCQPSSDPATCLTPAEANVVRKILNGPTDQKGRRLWFGLERGVSTFSGLVGSTAGGDFAPFPIATTHFAYWIKQNPTFDWKTVTEAGFVGDFRESQRKFNEVIGTDDPDLHGVRRHGGKVLIWHGESDQLIFPRGTLNYYLRVLRANGGIKHVGDFARLFMAPGVGHCAGGAGPNPVGTFDAVVNWVENGVAPDTLLASRTLPGGAIRTRPLCAFPKTAMWTGTGSTDDAANFVCMDGRHDAHDFAVKGRRGDDDDRDRRDRDRDDDGDD